MGGIEAEAVMLGQPISMMLPEVIGYKLIGSPQQLVTSTDIVLTVTKVIKLWFMTSRITVARFLGQGMEVTVLNISSS